MIGRLTGKIVQEGADGGITAGGGVASTVLLDVHGVGYEVTVPLGTLGRLATVPAAELSLFIHTHVREDALILYGFASAEDRSAFRLLTGVSNIGPKIALAILSVLRVDELAQLLHRGEASRLVAIPGVGKKTAERLVLELRDKIKVGVLAGGRPSDSGSTEAEAARGAVPADRAELVRGALSRLGFKPTEVERALKSLVDKLEHSSVEDLVREALSALAR